MADLVDPAYYFEKLYPLQDQVLRLVAGIDTGFYLTGGTAASRGYLQHRFSDDLDFFLNDHPAFRLWTDRIWQALQKEFGSQCSLQSREDRFSRFVLQSSNAAMLKLEFINDVPAHIGEIRNHTVLGRMDNPENILANKVTALLSRNEPKDLADIWGFCAQMKLPLALALQNAQSKAAGIFPPDLARVLCSAAVSDWEAVQWIQPPAVARFIGDLKELGTSLIAP